jgi:hypothetical protein
MNINMNKNIEKTSDTPINTAITDALLKLKKEPQKDGVDLTEIAKKLSDRKFGKDRRFINN